MYLDTGTFKIVSEKVSRYTDILKILSGKKYLGTVTRYNILYLDTCLLSRYCILYLDTRYLNRSAQFAKIGSPGSTCFFLQYSPIEIFQYKQLCGILRSKLPNGYLSNHRNQFIFRVLIKVIWIFNCNIPSQSHRI